MDQDSKVVSALSLTDGYNRVVKVTLSLILIIKHHFDLARFTRKSPHQKNSPTFTHTQTPAPNALYSYKHPPLTMKIDTAALTFLFGLLGPILAAPAPRAAELEKKDALPAAAPAEVAAPLAKKDATPNAAAHSAAEPEALTVEAAHALPVLERRASGSG